MYLCDLVKVKFDAEVIQAELELSMYRFGLSLAGLFNVLSLSSIWPMFYAAFLFCTLNSRLPCMHNGWKRTYSLTEFQFTHYSPWCRLALSMSQPSSQAKAWLGSNSDSALFDSWSIWTREFIEPRLSAAPSAHRPSSSWDILAGSSLIQCLVWFDLS